jgi:hypothetical protein
MWPQLIWDLVRRAGVPVRVPSEVKTQRGKSTWMQRADQQAMIFIMVLTAQRVSFEQ